MIKNISKLSGPALVLSGLAMAADEVPKFEAAIDYTLYRFNPATSLAPNKNLNGGGGAFTMNFGSMLGIKADVAGYGSTSSTYTIVSGNPYGVKPGVFIISGNLFTYTIGPVIKKHSGKFQPFGEILFGGAHSNVYGNLYHSIGVTSGAPSNNSFAMFVGGGIDYAVSKSIAVRVGEFDYALTRFGNNFTGNRNQNGFRYSAGVVFGFGGS